MPFLTPWLWAIFTVLAAASQTFRNAMQRGLTTSLGTIGATHVRFLFGLPFSLVFLGLILLVSGASLPPFTGAFFGWVVVGAFAQIAATGLMLATMRSKSFVVTTAYTKTEPVQAALFGFVALGDRLSVLTSVAILIATAGVMLLSWPRRPALADAAADPFDWASAVQGIAAGGMFALSAVGFRAAIRTLQTDNFVVAASATLVSGLILQAISMTLFIAIQDRSVLIAILRNWRQSMLAGFAGALASQLWFLAFAIETAARVRTLALVEIFFAQMISGRMFRERTSRRELIALILVAIGCVLIVNA